MNASSFSPGRGRLRGTAIHYGIAAVAALALGAGTASAAHAADPAPPPPLEAELPAPLPVKKYTVEAIQFKCDDESGVDWIGSDEPYFIFSSVGLNGTSVTRHSREFSDVDSGDVRTFAAGDGAIFPQPSGSAPAPNGIGVSVQLWEADQGSKAANVSTTGKYFKAAGAISVLTPAPAWVGAALDYIGTATSLIGQWLEDDLMGTWTYPIAKSELDARLPSVGSSYIKVVEFHTGPDYRLWVRIRRTA